MQSDRGIDVEAWRPGTSGRTAPAKHDCACVPVMWGGGLSMNSRNTSFGHKSTSTAGMARAVMSSQQARLVALPNERTADSRYQTSWWGPSHAYLYTEPSVGPGSYQLKPSCFGEDRRYQRMSAPCSKAQNRLGLPTGPSQSTVAALVKRYDL